MRLKAIEEESRELKKLLAEQMLDAAALRELPAGPAAKHDAVAHLQAVMGLYKRRACGIVGADRKMIPSRSRRPGQAGLRGRLRELAN